MVFETDPPMRSWTPIAGRRSKCFRSVGLAVGDVVEAGTRFGNAEAQTPEHLHVLRVVEHHAGQVGQDVERQISIPEDLRDIARCKLGAVADAAREGVVALELHELH